MSIPTPFATQRSRLKVQAIQHPTNVNHAYRLTRFWSWALADFLQQTGQLTGAHTPVLAQRIQIFIRTVGKYLIQSIRVHLTKQIQCIKQQTQRRGISSPMCMRRIRQKPIFTYFSRNVTHTQKKVGSTKTPENSSISTQNYRDQTNDGCMCNEDMHL